LVFGGAAVFFFSLLIEDLNLEVHWKKKKKKKELSLSLSLDPRPPRTTDLLVEIASRVIIGLPT